MKTPCSRSERAAALIIVLSFLILLSGLMVAFLSSTRTDVTSSADYVAGQESLALSETATNLVMGQIREATLSGIDNNGVGSHAWASQPGALRTWDNTGKFVKLYKLYSAKRMKEDDFTFLSTEIPAGWRTQTDEYVDVNEPIASGTSWRYPILDPKALGTVAGFSSTQTADSSVAWDTRTSMPVRWLYVNRNGEMSDTRQSDSVGRIAFWTDDESSKVNINTASGTLLSNPTVSRPVPNNKYLSDSYWEPPAMRYKQDYDMGRTSPREGEFQRYMGHPASVNLLSVFSGLSTNTTNLPDTVLQGIFDITPRYKWGGSENGLIITSTTAKPLTGADAKNERLYASVDELRFASSDTNGSRDLNTLPKPSPTPSDAPNEENLLDRWRFFLTAQSRSPDLNLFGRPRISLWPISGIDDTDHRTVYDSLIARCATLGPMSDPKRREYFFQRLYPLSQTKDWTEFPRNQTLLAYLRALTETEIPGFGGNYVKKYDLTNGGVAGERDQILVEMFDYIRCVNLNETYKGIPSSFVSYTPMVVDEITTDNVSSVAGAGFVLPIKTPYGRGAGRVPILSEMALGVLATGTSEATNQIALRPMMETFSPMQGPMPWIPKDFVATVSSGMTMGVENVPVILGGSVAIGPTSSLGANIIGGTDGIAWYNPSPSKPSLHHLTPATISGTALSLSGGVVTFSFAAAGEPPYQTFKIDFPTGASLPRPLYSGNRTLSGISGIPYRFNGGDVIHSMVYRDGDYRIAAYLEDVPAAFFKPHPRFGSTHRFAHSLISGVGNFSVNRTYPVEESADSTGIAAPADGELFGKYVGAPYFTGTAVLYNTITGSPDISPDIADLRAEGWEGDWNSGLGATSDGAYLGKSDEGHIRAEQNDPAYFNLQYWKRSEGFFSPTRQIPSAAVFGSLPTGVKRTAAAYANDQPSKARPWRTLLFSPNPDAGSAHYGMTSPPDYLLLDLFHLPVVEPYAISEPTSTAGRLNMNYQILPFTSITRKTAMHAVLSGKKVTAIPTSASLVYKTGDVENNKTEIRRRINIDETLKQFDAKFAANELFRSASEICSLFLIPLAPAGLTPENIADWWKDYRLTGDNVRERPYATIYPLLTTKSNTYTVHIRAQSLAPKTFKVTGEYRGSATLERYLDPNDSRLPGGSNEEIDPDTQSLEPLYRFRVIDTKRFAP